MDDLNVDSSLHLKNFTEILVDEVINKLWREIDSICKCDRCYYDTKAIALNHLPPKYTVTEKGEIYTKLNTFRSQVHVDIMKEVMNAILIVSKNSAHKGNEIE